ncbi:unnamed protein product [Spirodela intermedia]|uniref:Uncharacterized protein n=1 Tax=Spirodela intermedia TaxID=51605 RepID=A0A7I8IQ66_SPIIN|nr:unnamed protein product [Spirodela intermedia]CAA6659131.1 unnamed protein product [Spirodela intermedia]
MPPLMRSVSPSRFPSPPPSLLSSFHARTPVAVASFSPFVSQSGDGSNSNNGVYNRRRTKRLGAVERESEFEIDREKALAALEKLDQQLKALSEKETAPPGEGPFSSLFFFLRPRSALEGNDGVDTPEISGSVLAYSAIALLILTFVNNLLFGVFVKPYVDGDEPTPTVVRRSPGGAKEQIAPLLSEKP